LFTYEMPLIDKWPERLSAENLERT
jgi:hypothetical protein